MIGRLRGTLLEKCPPHLLIDVGGVAYEVSAPMFTFYHLPDIGQQATLHTHLVVREDAQLLFGFMHMHERALFRSLIKVSAVGPKLALAILSGMEAQHFVGCVMQNDTDSLVRIPGIGKKTAERLVIEMRDRLNDWQVAETALTAPICAENVLDNAKQEAISALIALGYKPQEAKKAISLIKETCESSEAFIRSALRNMMSKA
ncbi:MAG: Holliday junction branch migration protein RuvA [Gammaproteobacteria bacterium]|jgi:Holliday junction DNA helicase RuvA|nr:Holliday junction branch migration protein RuvA [Gammaproteobacteria bacterium]